MTSPASICSKLIQYGKLKQPTLDVSDLSSANQYFYLRPVEMIHPKPGSKMLAPMSKVRFRNKQLALRVISVRKPVTTNRGYVDDLSLENQYFYLWKMHREIGSKIMLAPMSKVRFRKKQLALCVTSFGVAACLLYQCCLTSTETVVTVGDWSWSSSFFTQLLNSESCSKHQFKGIHTHARINAYTRTRTRERARAHTHTHTHTLSPLPPPLSLSRACVCALHYAVGYG